MAASPSIIFMIIISIPIANADNRTELVDYTCGSGGSDMNETIYINNHDQMVSIMRGEMTRNKFAVAEFGNPPYKMYALSQCMNDLTNIECQSCFHAISEVVHVCSPSTAGARVYLDGCFIRLDNYSFYGEALGRHDIIKCSSDLEPISKFEDLAKLVVKKVVESAPGHEGFAMAEESEDDVSAYGMGVCWKTLSRSNCTECLNNAHASYVDCLPRVEGRVLNTGCFLRYSRFEFGNRPQTQQKNKPINYVLVYVSYATAGVAACTLAIALGFCVGKYTYKRKIRTNIQKGMKMDLSALQGSLQFKHSTLEKATESFIEANKLGHGGYGEVFKGTLPDGREIAVKRLFVSRKNRMKDICNEIDIISKAQHKNLVRFLGCCFAEVDSFLVYEYLANKSLDLILFDPEKKKELDWKKRLGIITGAAEGLEYLHKDCQVRIIHRDIKSSNILLDMKYRPKIADFGLARFYNNDKALMMSTAIAGTLGYMAPEYIAKGRLTEKADVYSFGVLVLEIVSGIQNNKLNSEDCFETIVTKTWKHSQANTVAEIIDESMEIGENVEEMKRVVCIGLLCTQESPALRPTMSSVVQMLKKEEMILPIPTKPPFTDESMELEHCLGTLSRNSSSASSLKLNITSDKAM